MSDAAAGLSLQDHLIDCMRETVLQEGRETQATRTLRAALRLNPTMTAEALDLIQAGAAVEARDHVTRWRNGLLRQALGATDVRHGE